MAEVAIIAVWTYHCALCGYESSDRDAVIDHTSDGNVHDGRWDQEQGAHLVEHR